MPLYTYQCKGCGYKIEAIEKYDTRQTPQHCPNCNKDSASFVDEIQPFVYSKGRSFSRMRHGK